MRAHTLAISLALTAAVLTLDRPADAQSESGPTIYLHLSELGDKFGVNASTDLGTKDPKNPKNPTPGSKAFNLKLDPNQKRAVRIVQRFKVDEKKYKNVVLRYLPTTAGPSWGPIILKEKKSGKKGSSSSIQTLFSADSDRWSYPTDEEVAAAQATADAIAKANGFNDGHAVASGGPSLKIHFLYAEYPPGPAHSWTKLVVSSPLFGGKSGGKPGSK